MSKLRSFDGLRFVGCIFIVLNHFGKIIYPHYNLPDLFFKRAGLAVEIFLILSGFLIAKNFFNLPQHSEHQNGAIFFDYFIKRIKRLYPEYFTALLICFLYKSIDFGDFNFRSFGLNMLLLGGIGGVPHIVNGIWYVTVLFWGGILLYGILLFSPQIGRYLIIPIISLFCLFYLVNHGASIRGHQTPIEFSLINKGFIRGILGLSIGIYCYQICNFIKEYKVNWNKKYLKYVLLLLEILSVVILCNNILLKSKSNISDFNIYICISYIVGLLYFKNEKLLKFLSLSIFVKLSTYSYSIYLTHIVIVNLITDNLKLFATISPWISYSIVTLLSVLFGMFSYVLTKKAVVFLKNKLIMSEN